MHLIGVCSKVFYWSLLIDQKSDYKMFADIWAFIKNLEVAVTAQEVAVCLWDESDVLMSALGWHLSKMIAAGCVSVFLKTLFFASESQLNQSASSWQAHSS